MSYHKDCPHQWNQSAPFIPTWVRETPSPKVCPQPIPPITPNPAFQSTATLQLCNPLKLEKSGPCSLLITISIPAESTITLPTKAIEIKTIKKAFRLTQNQFFNTVPTPPGIIHDTPKLFIGGLVRKDIQYSEAVQQTPTTVAGVMKDLVVDIPISCVVDLGRHLKFSPIRYDQQQEYELSQSQSKSPSTVEFNVLCSKFNNLTPTCQLLYYQINEIDNALDRVPLQGGPVDEYTFTTLQEKMIILIQLQLTFPTPIDNHDPHCSPDEDFKHYNVHTHCDCNKDCQHYPSKEDKVIEARTLFERINTLLSRFSCIIKGPRQVALL